MATSIDNSQQLYGTLSSAAATEPWQPLQGAATFSYRDINEPITIGTIAVVVGWFGAVTCLSNQLIGFLGNKQCKKLEAVYGFKFNFNNPVFGSDIGCHVRCN